MNRLVSLCGNCGSGKDSLAEHFIDDGYKNIKFSQPVKNLIAEILGKPLNMATDRSVVIDVSLYLKGKKTPKQMTEKYGFEFIRYIDNWAYDLAMLEGQTPYTDEFWAYYTFRNLNKDKMYVFTDIRLNSEYNVAKDNNTKFIFLDCPQHIRERRLVLRDGGFSPDIWQTEFETTMLSWDYDLIVDATKPLEEIYKEVREFLNE